MVKKILIVYLLIFIQAGSVVCASEKDLIFYLPFDGSVVEQIKGIMGEGQNYVFVEGKNGQGAYFPSDAFVHYPARDNINYRQGTVEFWVKPDWDGDDGGYHYFFAGNIDNANNINSIHVSKKYYEGGVVLGQIDSKPAITGNDAGRAQQEAVVPFGPFQPTSVVDWRKGQWHHLAFTWDDKKPELKLYIDGFLRATNSNKKALENAFPSDYMSYINVGSSIDHVVFANAIIDELKIWNYPKTDMEIAQSAGLKGLENFTQRPGLFDKISSFISSILSFMRNSL